MMSEPPTQIETEVQKINLKKFDDESLILDIGGGGEGLVSRIAGNRVCALDIRMSEVREAQIHGHSSNWFVADGMSLCFKDETFDIVTLWFSLGYMSSWSTKEAVLREASRILKTGGQLSIMASRVPDNIERFIFWVTFTLPDGTLSKTGYGVRGGQDQTLPRVLDCLTKTGFVQHQYEDHAVWFEIEAQKV